MPLQQPNRRMTLKVTAGNVGEAQGGHGEGKHPTQAVRAGKTGHRQAGIT